MAERENKYRVLGVCTDAIKRDGKPVLSDDGVPIYEPEQECKVIASNIPDIKKGMMIVPILRGGVPIRLTDSKKTYNIILDAEDIYGIKI